MWIVPVPAILPIIVIVVALFLFVLAIQYWWISLLLILGLIAAKISRRIARQERTERARHLAKPQL